jgi:6-phosphogluconolactonase
MIHDLCQILLPLTVAAALAVSAVPARGEEVLIFVSSFAPGDQGAIHALHLDLESGELRSVHRTEDVEHPFFLALSPDRRFLYSIHAPGQFGGENDEQIAAFELVGRTGELKLLNRQSARGTAACYLDVDAMGRTVLVANYTTGSVAALPIQEDGSLGQAASFIQHAGSSILPDRQSGPHAHCLVISPDNRHALAADLGLDQVLIYQLDAATARLIPGSQPFVRTIPGAGPRHLVFHPGGEQVYVINELANSVTWFDYLAETGMLIERQTVSTLPDDFDGTSHCADLKITPDGRFLYGTNRGHDSLAAYRIVDEGELRRMAIYPSLGRGPQNLAITPDGKWLLCANMPGNNLAVFRIDAETGELTAQGEPFSIPSPSCILLP